MPDGLDLRTITLNFERDQLMYDISNVCYVTGDVLKTDDEHARHQIIDVTEDGNVDRVTRMLDLAFGEVQQMLSAFTKDAVTDGDITNDEFTETDTYVITLKVPSSIMKVTQNYLEQLIHNLLVDWAVMDWLTFTHPDKNEASVWAAKAEDLKSKINAALSARNKRVRIKQHPFP